MLPLSNVYLFTATRHLTKAAYRQEGIRGLQFVGTARCGPQGAAGGPRCDCLCPYSQEAESSCCCRCPALFFVSSGTPPLAPPLSWLVQAMVLLSSIPFIYWYNSIWDLICTPGPNLFYCFMVFHWLYRDLLSVNELFCLYLIRV